MDTADRVILTGEYLKNYNNDVKYVLTHLAASYCYGGAEVAFVGARRTDKALWCHGIHQLSLWSGGTANAAAISLSSTKETAFLEGAVQKTKNITLNGDHRNYITLPLPEGVTIMILPEKDKRRFHSNLWRYDFLLYRRKNRTWYMEQRRFRRTGRSPMENTGGFYRFWQPGCWLRGFL